MNVPYSNIDLEHALGMPIQIYNAWEIDKYDINSMLHGPTDYIILYHGQNQSVGHWTCCIFIDDSTVEYFDPLGSKSSYKPTKIKRFFTKHGFKVIVNTKQLQRLDSDNCGKFILTRIQSRHQPLDVFLKLFRNRVLSPDEIVMLLIAVSF